MTAALLSVGTFAVLMFAYYRWDTRHTRRGPTVVTIATDCAEFDRAMRALERSTREVGRG